MENIEKCCLTCVHSELIRRISVDNAIMVCTLLPTIIKQASPCDTFKTDENGFKIKSGTLVSAKDFCAGYKILKLKSGE